jgi:hypothetical protein
MLNIQNNLMKIAKSILSTNHGTYSIRLVTGRSVMGSHSCGDVSSPDTEGWGIGSPYTWNDDSGLSRQDGSGEADVAPVINEWVAARSPRLVRET